MCANKQVMSATGEVDLQLEIGDLKITCNALIVNNLSTDVILGNDHIKSLSFNEHDDHIKINNVCVPLYDPYPSTPAYVSTTTWIEPYSDNVVQVRNPFFPGSKHVNVSPLDAQKPNNVHIVQDAIYENSEYINVIVTNRQKYRRKLSKKLPLCVVKPISINQVTALQTLKNDPAELEEVLKFQRRRATEADRTHFCPEIGSFGDVTDNQKSELQKLIFEKRLAFSMGSHDLGELAYFRYKLPLHDETKTAHQTQRPIPLSLREKVQAEINKWQQVGIIKPSQSAFNIPLIILRKADGSIRISLDARQLNQLLIPDRFPLPHMNEVISRIGEKLSTGKECFVSSFDWMRGYWTVRVADEDQHKLSFAYKNQHFKASRMLYGTSTAPSAFARIMQDLFGDHDSFIVYLDDLLIVDSSFEEHMKSLQFLFNKCLQHGILLNAKKCNLCATKMEFLGHKFTKDGIFPLNKHVLAIQNYPVPTDKKELKRFIGMTNFNLKFIPRGSVLMGPLYKAVSAKRPFEWTAEQQTAFESIKTALASAKCLHHRNPKLELILVNDASKLAVGSTLYQMNGDTLETLGFSSRRLTDPEVRRPMRSKELLALSYGVKAFEYYLIGTPFKIVSDHKSLTYLYREHMRTQLDLKLSNIFFYLQHFEFQIVHRPGNSEIMASADALSRLPSETLDELHRQLQYDEIPDRVFSMVHLTDQFEKDTAPKMKYFLRTLAKGNETQTEEPTKYILQFEEFSITPDKMIELQNQCTSCKDIIHKLKINSKSAVKKFKLIDGLLYQKGPVTRIVLPNSLANEFIQYTHVAYGHCGIYQLIKLLKKHVYIFSLPDRCTTITKRCTSCIRHKTQNMPRPSLIEKKQFEHHPFTRTHCDLYDLGVKDSKGKRYLVTFADSLTGYLDGIPIASKRDELVSEAIYEMILRHGITGRLVTDNGREFGPLTTAILKKFAIIHVRTSAYMSRSNGRVERCHREITAKLKLLDANRRNWSSMWPLVKFYLNNLPKTTLDGLTACEALYGRPLYCPLDNVEKIESDSKQPYIKALNQYLENLYPSLLNFQQRRHENLLKNFKGNAEPLKIGDECLVYKPSVSEGKLGRCWEGPFKIIKRISKHTYILRDPKTQFTYRRNCRHLRKISRAEHKTQAEIDEDASQPETPPESTQLEITDEFANAKAFPFADYVTNVGQFPF